MVTIIYYHGQKQLRWVLPSPSLIYPGKNQNRLLEKRNRLLKKIMLKGFIDQEEYDLSIIEPLPQNLINYLKKQIIFTICY